jgi:cardiolipin synthase (CMP-forming)
MKISSRLTVPTMITLLRMLLVPFVAMAILYHRYGVALLIFLISGISDLLDGLLARTLKQKTKLGALLDPMADKLLLSTLFILLTLSAIHLTVTIPIWLTLIVFGRDVIIVVSAVAIALTTGFTNFDPSIYGKTSTAIQILCVLLVLILNYLGQNPFWVKYLFLATFAITTFSGIHYIYLFTKRFSLENQ